MRSSRSATGCRSAPRAGSSSGCSRCRPTGSPRTAGAGAGWYQRGSDLLTSALWRRSLRHAAAVVAGSQATAAELGGDVPGRLPGPRRRLRPRPGPRGALRVPPRLVRPARQHRDRARRVRPARHGRGAARRRRARRPRAGAARARRPACPLPRPGERRGARRPLPRRAGLRRRAALRGVRLPGARGDGLRRAGGGELHDLDPGGRRRRGPALRPARRGRDRRGARARAGVARSRRGACASAGYAQAARFTWAKTGEGFAAVLDGVLG